MSETKSDKVYSLVARNGVYLRNYHNYTQRDLASKINRTQGTIAQIERGESVTLSNLETLASFFGIKSSSLIELDLEKVAKTAVEEALKPYKTS